MNVNKKLSAVLIGGATAMTSLFANAATMEQCRALTTDSARLACYDKLAASPAPVAAMPAAAKPAEISNLSPMQAAWDIGRPSSNGFAIRPYRSVYLLPIFANDGANKSPSSPTQAAFDADEIKATEAKFQISGKTRVAENLLGDNGDVWVAYTQSSRWQVYSDGISRPFRETNYEPEAMFLWKTNYQLLGLDMRFATIGFNHQSNGRAGDLSRSWNRVIGQVGFEKNDWTMTARAWYRLPEDIEDDDNPNIEKYLGYGEAVVTKRFGTHMLTATAHPPGLAGSDSKGSLRLDYSFPLVGALRGYVQGFTGYGESMIDYNYKANYLGVGVSLVE